MYTLNVMGIPLFGRHGSFPEPADAQYNERQTDFRRRAAPPTTTIHFSPDNDVAERASARERSAPPIRHAIHGKVIKIGMGLSRARESVVCMYAANNNC